MSISLFCLVLRLRQVAFCGDLVSLRLGASFGSRAVGVGSRFRDSLLAEPESRIVECTTQTSAKKALSGLRIRKGGLEGRFELLRCGRGNGLACSRSFGPCLSHQCGDDVALLFRDSSNLLSIELAFWRSQLCTQVEQVLDI